MRLLAALFMLAGISAAADSPTVQAELVPLKTRKHAPDFALKDASGRATKLKNYRGKVVVLDFWATWCHGCKQEIPWFAELANKYRAKGVAVVGISMDDGGWAVLNPFLAGAKIPYTILLGNPAIGGRYGIDAMPDTFLIDRKGHMAASYTGGLVDKENLEANIQAILNGK